METILRMRTYAQEIHLVGKWPALKNCCQSLVFVKTKCSGRTVLVHYRLLQATPTALRDVKKHQEELAKKMKCRFEKLLQELKLLQNQFCG